MSQSPLPIPPYFDSKQVESAWRVNYQQRAADARHWARQHGIAPAANDTTRIALLAVDIQNTFCVPGYELFVAGQSGRGAVEDNIRLCQFIYRNLGRLTTIVPTMDTHTAHQIFHAAFLVNENGEHPAPYTSISANDIQTGKWKFNGDIAPSLGISAHAAQEHLRHYTRALEAGGKYALTIWPYHAMLGGIGHALTSAFEECVFFHSIARHTKPQFQIKGDKPLTENYSAIGPEVIADAGGKTIGGINRALLDLLFSHDIVLVAGQAKSHCVAWTVRDILDHARQSESQIAHKLWLLQDCTSPVVVPGADYTETANNTFRQFASEGARLLNSTDSLDL